VLIESHWPLAIDARVSLNLGAGVVGNKMHARVRHVTSSPGGYLIGLELVDPDATLLERLRELSTLID
jgi:hypothetical protein